MSKYYYAGFSNTNEIAIFKTTEKRDAWIAYQDAMSIATGTTADNCFSQRETVSASEAKMLDETLPDDLTLDDDMPTFVEI